MRFLLGPKKSTNQGPGVLHIHLLLYNTLTTLTTLTTLKYTLLSDVSNCMKVGTLKAVLYKEEVETTVEMYYVLRILQSELSKAISVLAKYLVIYMLHNLRKK